VKKMELEFDKKVDLKSVVRVFRYEPRENNVSVVTDNYICESGWLAAAEEFGCFLYQVSDYLLRALIHGCIHECIGCSYEIIAVPKPVKIVKTTHIYANTPLWTTFWEAWIFKHYGSYYAFLVSPTVGSTLYHYVTRHPVKLYSLNDEHLKEKLKIRELKEGHCIFCGAKLGDEPDYYDWGIGHRGEPNVPVYVCPKCGHKNYGFRLGELIKDFYGK